MTTRKHEIEESIQAMDVPPEATAAIKLTRADAVKMVATEMAEQCAGDADRWGLAVREAADRFWRWMVLRARTEKEHVLDAVRSAVGAAEIHGHCTYRVYKDGSDSGDVAQVVFSDHQQSYEARFRVAVDVALDDRAFRFRDEWATALARLEEAHERDQRMGAMKKEAREALIKAALADTPAGQTVVDAIKSLAAVLRAKV